MEGRATAASEPVCPHCGGAGYVRRPVPLGHPDFGRAVPCVCVLRESETERYARLLRYSNLGALSRYTFATLSPRGRGGPAAQQERYERAVAAARAFAERPQGWLVLQGASGSGKTHLAAALAHAAIAAGRPALFMVVPDLLDHLRTAFAPASEVPYDRLFDQVRNAELLVLDDLGAQSTTPWAAEKLYQLINHRFNLALPTVFTLSGPLDELDERLRSRLGDTGLSQVYRLDAGGVAPESSNPLDLPLLREMTFATFNYRPTGPDLTDAVARKLQQAWTQALDFARRPDGWLVLEGESGTGKTHLAAAIAHQQREAGLPCLFVVVPDFLDALRAAAAGGTARETADSFERVSRSAFLVLDDLGVHSDTPWAQEKLFQLLNYRYNAKLPTVICLRPSDEIPVTWHSRLYDDKVSSVVKLDVPDYRHPDRPRTPPVRRGRAIR
jgi:DNA replication protein DnaC